MSYIQNKITETIRIIIVDNIYCLHWDVNNTEQDTMLIFCCTANGNHEEIYLST